MAQVVLFNDKSTDVFSFRRTLGPYRIAQALKDAGYTVQVVEWFSSWSRNDLALIMDKLLGPDTLWVGWSSTFMVGNSPPSTPRAHMWSRSLNDMDWLFDYIKARSKAWLVYGGAYAHLFAFDDRIDTYITGYADTSVIAYTHSLAQGNLPPRFVDSRTYPEPDPAHIDTDWSDPSYCLLPNEALPIEMARGCIFQCKFCSYPLIGKKKGTYQRPVEQIRDQMLRAHATTGCNRFYFTDDTFNDDRERLAELHAMFKTLPFKPQFSCFLRLDLIERWPETADLVLDMGLVGCFFGVETFNKKSAQCVGKGLDPKRTKAELVRLRALWGDRVLVSVGLILGLPYDTEEYFKELEAWATDPACPVDNLSINTLWLGPPAPEGATQSDGWSQFNLNLDVYGYKRVGRGWSLPSNSLDNAVCDRWRSRIIGLFKDRARISEFYVQDYANLGIGLEEMKSMSVEAIHRKYPISRLLVNRQREYQKSLIEFLGIK
jgi:hypothetical protein